MVIQILQIGLLSNEIRPVKVRENQKNSYSDKVISEYDIKQYVLERFEEVKNSKKIRKLVEFQEMNKYMIMSHDQEALKNMGNLVASYKKIPLTVIVKDYEKHLRKALGEKPTTKTHVNVIMHIFGYFSKEFNRIEKDRFCKLLNDYREGKITVGKILSEINPLVFKFNNTYLASQTYFLLYSDILPGISFQPLQKN